MINKRIVKQWHTMWQQQELIKIDRHVRQPYLLLGQMQEN